MMLENRVSELQLSSNSKKYKLHQISSENTPPEANKGILSYWVGMSKDLARAAWHMSYREKRVLMLAMSRIDYFPDNPKLTKWNGESLDFGTVMVTADDYMEFTGKNRSDSLRDLRTVVDTIKETSVMLLLPDDSLQEQKLSVVFDANYSSSDGAIKIIFSKDILRHMHKLNRKVGSEGYTSYYLKQVQNLNLTALRLFELLKSHSPHVQIEMTQIKHALGGCKEDNLLRKFIRPAVSKLRTELSWKLEFKVIKRPRKIKMIKFSRYSNPTDAVSVLVPPNDDIPK